MNSIVSLIAGQPVTTSLVIAEGVQHEHRAVMKLVRDHLPDFDDFGRVAFEVQPFRTAGGTQQREVAVLNEHQATLLITFMRNIGPVKEFKKRLVKAFWEMARRLQQPAVPQTLPDALRLAADLAERATKAESELAVLAPKVEAFDRLADADGLLNPTNAAKVLQLQPKRLFAFMRENGWTYRRAGGRSDIAYQDKIAAGYLTHKVRVLLLGDGSERVCEQVLVTAKGLRKLAGAVVATGSTLRSSAHAGG